jgi:hypothetical protein
MNFVQRFLNWDDRKPDAAFSPFGVDNLPPEMREGMTLSGALAPKISRAEALQVPAVLRSRNLICTPAALPIHLRNKEREIVEGSDAPTTLFDQIDPDIPNIVVMASTYEDLLFESASLWRVVERNYQGWPTYAEHIEHRRWGVASDGIYIDGYPVDDENVIVFRSPNPPLLVHAARAIRTCLTLDQTASRYADDPMGLGYLTPKDGARVDESDAKISGLLDKWESNRRKRVWGYVGAALEAKTLQFNAEQIQLADQRQHAVLEIARAAGVDPERLGVSTTSRTYKNAETERLDMLDFTHRAYVSAIEQRLSMGDVTPRGWYVKTNLDAFLRSDTKTRMETYELGKPLGLYPDERLAELEDIPRIQKPPMPTRTLVPVPDNAQEMRGNP